MSPGCGGPPNSIGLALGVPFGLTLTGSSYASSGFFPEDAAYGVDTNFKVTDADGQVLTLTEIPIPSPEPTTAVLAALELAVALIAWRRSFSAGSC